VITPSSAQAMLDEWNTGGPCDVASRLGSALAETSPNSSKGAADIAVLLRQCLRGDDERRLGGASTRSAFVPAWLEVPVCRLFPEPFPWKEFGLLPQRGKGQFVRISSEPWRPDWLSVPDGMSVDGDAAEPIICRVDESVQGDPFLLSIDNSFTTYKTPGQRSSVRSAIVLPAGATLVVNLPTGAGKTLAMLAAAEIATVGMTSVIVVPTVALALDQERRYRSQNPGSPATAYHGGLSAAEKQAFRDRIRSGDQRVIFTNPEAAVSSLAWPLVDAARGGRIGLLGIDEAHVVGSWGDAFRPHFHSLAGLRTLMLREAKHAGHPAFKTILASATLTGDVLSLLRALFGTPGPFLQVAAPVMRPEPSYWHAIDLEPSVREGYLIQALRHLPRPVVVYTTLRQDQRPGTFTPHRLADLLRANGFKRLAIVDGKSSTSHREHVLLGLREDSGEGARFDLVVATSAFGLGIDVPDIRSVIHACLPEGIDRFYQEVGRGGRDGNASISVLLATREDENVARGLASPTYLTSERARERWGAMFHASRGVGDGLRRLPLTAISGEVRKNSDYNESWNLFTVVLLARSGAVAWDFSLSERGEDGELESDRGWLTVRIVRGDHQTDSFWEDVVESTRKLMVENADRGLLKLRKSLTADACAGMLIAESFSIEDPYDLRTTCLAACGGCGWCRAHGKRRWASPSPIPAAIAAPSDSLPLSRLAIHGAFGRRIAICMPPSIFDSRRRLRELLPRLVSAADIRLVVAESSLLEAVREAITKSPALVNSVMLDACDDFDPTTAIGVSTLALLPGGQDLEDWLEGNSRAPLTVVCGVPDSPVGSLKLSEVDGCYPIAIIEELQ
jgi:hypothetical protein